MASSGDGSGHGQVQVDHMPSAERPRHGSPMSETSRYLWRETAGLRDLDSYDEEVNRLYRESRSPLRVRSLQSHRVQSSTFDEWEYMLREGKVTRLEALGEVGEFLVKQDADRALAMLFNHRMRFKNLEQFYALRDSIISSITRSDPLKVLDVFRGLEIQGAHMNNARFFTECWAQNDPRATAERFEELMQYRNMGLEGGTPEVPYDEFAQYVMKSWLSQDPEQAEAYLEELPEGRKRDALQQAFDQLTANP